MTLTLKSTTFLTLVSAWLVMLALDWLFPLFLLPDLVLLMTVALYFTLDDVPVWFPLFFISVLLDITADITFGIYGLTYSACVVVILPFIRHMRMLSGLEQLIIIGGLSCIYTFVRGVLLYVIDGLPSSPGWILPIIFQMLLWPFARALAERVLRPYMPREDG